MRPLEGIRILDFTTLLPGPMATLVLAEAGAEVIKIERPGIGDELRINTPKIGADAIDFALLNRGKRSVAIDLKEPRALVRLRPLIATADVVVEQFRPGVMDRLGLGYPALKGISPRIIYCAITGYGQSGPRAQTAAHDLNYVADAGLLAIAAGSDGAPVVPAALVADIAGGSYPAVINILLALRQRDRTGEGCKLDISMTDNVFPFLPWAFANGFGSGRWPEPAGERLSGGSPRYQIYRTADDKFIAAAPLEERFWQNFCDAIALPEGWRNDSIDPRGSIEAVAAVLRGSTAEQWQARFAGKDVCCCIVKTLREALADPHFQGRGLFSRTLKSGEWEIPAVPVAVVPEFRGDKKAEGYPELGEANSLLDEAGSITTSTLPGET